MTKYIPSQIEPKWQKKWEEDQIYTASDSSDKPKKYILDMFPYPSGDGLHVGHFKGYVASDIISRYFRLKGFNVLHPMGWDAFGLPAENYAIKMGIHPSITTARNIANIKKQMQLVSLSYDWKREIDTTDPNYYKWTQWIFLKLFEKGLAYEDDAPINWCPKDKTGLANEEVIDGKCARCGEQVEQKKIRQWILRITKYADRLLEDLEGLNWPEFIKEMQINWIGRSEGMEIQFPISNFQFPINVYTVFPETIFGVTYMVLAPEHQLVKKLITKDQEKEVEEYLKASQKKTELQRKAEEREKSGVFTGSYCINPVNGKKVPIWISDYVVGGYGTGAVMGVPGSDHRDFAFAKKYGLEIIRVIGKTASDFDKVLTDQDVLEEGVIVNSEQFNGLKTPQDAREKIKDWLAQKKWGMRKIQYHLRDWIFSRQRYWGEPIPLVHCPKCGVVPVPENELPLKLPDVKKYEPTGTGESPLAAIPEWVNTVCPKCGGPGKRETNTMPQWAGSCWYYLRFIDPNNNQVLLDKEKDKYWMPVDWYIGGAEHAVLHLLYARFWHKVLFDIGAVSTKEPFQKLTSVGLVLAEDGRKMSKSLGNVITPDEIVKEYGADTLRLYEAFMGPFENTISWDPTSINGVYKFLNRVWELICKEEGKSVESRFEIALNKLVKKVASDIEAMKFNTAVAAAMEFINLTYHHRLTSDQKKKFLIVLAPFAPHITEELWSQIGEKYSIHKQSWPAIDNKFLEEDEVSVAVQVNGKVRDILLIQKDMISNKEVVEKMAKESQKAAKFLEGKSVKKVVYVPGKIISFVLSSS
ncbi:MAG: hypothetical protein ACD_38C00208G0001 [uncultured bacterium]|uniref:Leucine--tRNA ligase n=1 Tax=Candidatus Daviesbacteria bacterium GW2011_GWC2_40_12 TaxID=1618431 RepID=A0A0G0T2M3_9BACT|nr:MAG: hypothetical protein ACD_38C00208G0001 [uncultured bacterium]KKR16480.1 MAG: Leucine-tRNA ligase [Candidatus Daviesbacteria bacterium GW2011_GWA2_39_33]KKR41345.1 MAG: Leucine-tRNA ligase [Candidatus Daviesbacteria bacterium GW2011_GWC2_40_12]OGE21472.1 MAG: leucine--tRNA ligase [Candidatus Daviesbacteria bacterium RIFCSPHIGHO2_01_FULL_40_24]OGE29810.1 MAG: leucine--tRNA ligase [Candidatus Daviesbacteria bacterium RIFCSPHIGHO2_02_FULL_40_16]OGE42759.1 MAG: leucine--tRNA ligase [Candida